MSNTSFDLTGKLPAEQLELLACLQAAANRLSLPLLLVGATVRDLFLHHLYGKRIRRATDDLDLTVQTDTWAQFLELLRISHQGEHSFRFKVNTCFAPS
jgi:predicted nucleotidyltransferase